ncbi:MAG TPA: helix-turn-helix domain-containing protein [Solirubrobacterales bacterium]|nr:helix-turn-helix domain-containing protein [Solirubrobacterales bacterium]
MDHPMHEEEEEAARERRARSHSTRVAILALLAEDDRELTVPQIRAELPDSFTLRNIYYHLRVLEVSHLLARDGSRYRLT